MNWKTQIYADKTKKIIRRFKRIYADKTKTKKKRFILSGIILHMLPFQGVKSRGRGVYPRRCRWAGHKLSFQDEEKHKFLCKKNLGHTLCRGDKKACVLDRFFCLADQNQKNVAGDFIVVFYCCVRLLYRLFL